MSDNYTVSLNVLATTSTRASLPYFTTILFPTFPIYKTYSGEKYVHINDYIVSPVGANTKYTILVSKDRDIDANYSPVTSIFFLENANSAGSKFVRIVSNNISDVNGAVPYWIKVRCQFDDGTFIDTNRFTIQITAADI